VPPAALAQTTLALTGLTAKKRKAVPLSCGVTIGGSIDRISAVDVASDGEVVSAEQLRLAAIVAAATERRFDSIVRLLDL